MCVSQQFQIFGNSIISFADTSNIIWENDVMHGISQLSRRLGASSVYRNLPQVSSLPDVTHNESRKS